MRLADAEPRIVRDAATGLELPQLATTNVRTANASGVELELTVVQTDNLTFILVDFAAFQLLFTLHNSLKRWQPL